MNQFQVFCPSNSSMDLYTNNTISNFTVDLNPAIELSGSYEAGLAEIQYPNSWENIRHNHNNIWLVYTRMLSPGNSARHSRRLDLNPGYYESVASIQKVLDEKKEIRKYNGLKHVKIEVKNGYVTISVAEKDNTENHNHGYIFDEITFSGDILKVCGFTEKELILSRGENKKASLQPHPSAGFHNIFVYSDVISEQYIGDTFAPILRILPVEKERSTWGNLMKTYDPIYYIPVRKNRITSLKFELNNDVGENIPFSQYGHVIIILHFRKTV